LKVCPFNGTDFGNNSWFKVNPATVATNLKGVKESGSK